MANRLADFVSAVKKPFVESDKDKCIKTGGTWDEATQTCEREADRRVKEANEELANRTPEQIAQQNVIETRTGTTTQEQQQKTIITEEQRAEMAPGSHVITDRFGNERIQTREDIDAREAGFAEQGQPTMAENLKAEYLKQQQIQQQIAQIGQLGNLTAAQEADINLSQAITAGGASAISGVIGGAVGGATIGALGGPIGVIGGAILGGVGTFVSGLIGNIKEQQRGELQAADVELSNARTNMRQLAMLASQDPANADMYIQQYNQQLTRIYQARRQTKAEVSGDLNSWMEDGREQLADFDAFLQEGGIADIYGQKLAIAMQTGVPLSINGEGLLE